MSEEYQQLYDRNLVASQQYQDWITDYCLHRLGLVIMQYKRPEQLSINQKLVRLLSVAANPFDINNNGKGADECPQ